MEQIPQWTVRNMDRSDATAIRTIAIARDWTVAQALHHILAFTKDAQLDSPTLHADDPLPTLLHRHGLSPRQT